MRSSAGQRTDILDGEMESIGKEKKMENKKQPPPRGEGAFV